VTDGKIRFGRRREYPLSDPGGRKTSSTRPITMKTFISSFVSIVAGTSILVFAGCGNDSEDVDYRVQETRAQPAPSQPDQSSTGEYSGAPGSENAEMAGTQSGQNSEALKERIRDSLSEDSQLALNDEQLEKIEIKIEEATVVLSGSVPSEEDVQLIEQRVSEISGVAFVQNDLRAGSDGHSGRMGQ